MSAGRVILASAGTGKTHHLSGRYIERLVANTAPAEILAATFTRSAAGEIMDRVLKRMARTACGDTTSWPIENDPGAITNARRALLQSVRALHLWRVSTIDGVLGSLARMLSTELEVAPGWSMIDDDTDRQLRERAITETLEAAEPDETVALIRMLHDGGQSRQVFAAIERAVQQTYAAYLDASGEPAPWSAVGPPPEHDHSAATRMQQRLVFLERIEAFALPTTKAGDVRKNWATNFQKLAAALHNDDSSAILNLTLIQRLADDPPMFDRVEMTQGCVELLWPIAQDAINEQLGSVRDRNRAIWTLVHRFDQAYTALKRRLGLVTFTDVPRMLLASEYHGRLDHLYYRLDARIRDVLLDEFQDTSREQFALLEPLLHEIATEDGGEGRGVMVVGDVKQSLYGWRGASPELLPALADRWETLERETLVRSYRSSLAVLGAVNVVFSGIDTNPALAAHADVASRWAAGFAKHIAAYPKLAGSVAVLQVHAVDPESELDIAAEDNEDSSADEANDQEAVNDSVMPTTQRVLRTSASVVVSMTR